MKVLRLRPEKVTFFLVELLEKRFLSADNELQPAGPGAGCESAPGLLGAELGKKQLH